MKKILLVLICLMLFVGCEKKENNTGNEVEEPKPEQIHLTKMELNQKLFEMGIDIYTKKSYQSFEKNSAGEYFISLDDLDKKLHYDTSLFVSETTQKPCDKLKTGVVIDIDNVRKVEYKEYPIMIELYCD